MIAKPPPGRLAIRLGIHGDVQGVWYRSWARQQAAILGVAGWVRNRRDGTVEAQIEGPAEAVERMYLACHRGPPLARVARIERSDTEPEGLRDFEERPTA